ncbi:MAG: oligoendopeptidase F family protein [Ktedonobacterales bacterium]|nr:oligoendopeptidase F family protein [Ktedonobacterales bacterium]
MMETTLPRRADVPREQTWAIESVYSSDAAWEEAVRAAAEAVPGLARFHGRLGESASVLLEALRARDQWITTAWRIRLYANMQVKADTADSAAAARLQRAERLRGAIAEALAYIEPELLTLDSARLDALIAASPPLGVYTHAFAVSRRRAAHIAPAAVEAVLAGADPLGAVPYATYKALVNGDLRFSAAHDATGAAHPVAPSTIDALLRSPDRALRRSAWHAYTSEHVAVRNTLAHLLAGAFQRDVFSARARGYASALDAALDAAFLPREVYLTLLESCRRHQPLWHRAWELRRRILGLEHLAPYDLDVPLSVPSSASGSSPSSLTPYGSQGTIPYDEARRIVLAAVAPLGADYSAILRRGLYEERWVDWATNQGKLGGAEQSGVHGTRPFILLTYEGSLISVSALAHELGHAMHAYYTWATQPPIYEGYPDWLSETTSTFHQALVRAYLLREHAADPTTQRAVLAEALAYYERYLFQMPLLAQLEWEGHERLERGQSLDADWLSTRTLELLAEGYGSAVALEDARAGIVWARFPHLYLNFYTYQYSLGMAAANLLADAVAREGAPAAERTIALLRVGASVYPLDALRAAGVDLATPAPVEAAFAALATLLDRLEALGV